MEAWDTFMEKYGFRGPMGMDVAAPRFYEQPALFFSRLVSSAARSRYFTSQTKNL